MIGPASDAWALGCTLAHLFLGRPLFAAATPEGVLAAQAELLGRHDRNWPGVRRLPGWAAAEKQISAAAQAASVRRAAEAASGSASSSMGWGPARRAADADAGPPSAREAMVQLGLGRHQAALVADLLRADPSRRLTARDAVTHEYFRGHRPPAEVRTRLVAPIAAEAAGLDPCLLEHDRTDGDSGEDGVVAPQELLPPHSAVPRHILAEAVEQQTATVRSLLADPFPLLAPLRLSSVVLRAAST